MGLLSWIYTLASLFAGGVAVHLLNNSIPRLALLSICFAASRLPLAIRASQKGAWLADFALLETDVEKINCAIGCVAASLIEEPPFYMFVSRRRLKSARNSVKILADVTLWSVRRLEKMGAISENGRLDLQRKYLIASILATRDLLKPNIKKYCEHWIEHHSRYPAGNFQNVQEVQIAMLEPVIREIEIYRILEKDFAKYRI